MAITRQSVVTYNSDFNNAYTLTSVTASAGDLIIVACAGRTSSLLDWPTPTWNGETFTVVTEVVAEPIGLEVYKLIAGSSGTYNITATASDYGGVVAIAAVYSGSSLDIDGVQTGEWYTGTYSLPSETVSGYVSGNIIADFLVATLRNDGDVDVPDTLYITNGTNVSTINSNAGRVGRMYFSEHTSGSVSYTKSDSEMPKYRIAAFRIFESGGSSPTINTYPATVRSGSTGNTYTTTGLTSVTAISIGALAATSISDTSGDGTHNVPSLTDGVAHELYGTKTVTITGTEGSPTTSTNFQPLSTQSFVTLSGTINTTDTGVLYNFSPAAAVGDQIVWTTANGTVDAQGNYAGDFEGTQTMWHIDATDRVARSYSVITGVGSNILKYWNGSAWVEKPLKYWNGSAWVAKTLKYWNGSAWV